MGTRADVVRDALVSGLAGAVALTLIHETARRVLPDAPRMDTLGRRALARGFEALGREPPRRDALQGLALAGDLASNTLYYALVGVGGAAGAAVRGAVLGAAAGVGAVVLPPRMGLGRRPSQLTNRTRVLTVAWYLAGGLAAAATFRGLRAARGA
jgi:hypothetical protein